MKIAALIISYNGEKTIYDTVKSLLNNKSCDTIFIFDNASTDNTLKIIEKINNKKIFIIRNDKNVGLGKAINIVIKNYVLNNFDWILLSDQDSSYLNNSIDILYNSAMKLMSKKVELGAICGVARNREHKNFLYFPYEWQGCKFVNIDIASIKDEYINIGSYIMSGTLYNVEVFKKIGFFNEEYFIDFIEHEFNYRMTKEYNFFMINKLLIMHDLGNRVIKTKEYGYIVEHRIERYYFMARNMINFYLKNNEMNFIINLLKFHDLLMKEYSTDYQGYCIYRNKGIFDGIISNFETPLD
jgi:rhamnosyltransferase